MTKSAVGCRRTRLQPLYALPEASWDLNLDRYNIRTTAEMAQNYSEYLAINVLNEQQNVWHPTLPMRTALTQQQVNYRQLSRALKVHSNLAKQMLYEFHRKQNAKKPGSVHATYLLTGTRRSEPTQPQTNGGASQDEDTVMQSSPPFPSSSAPKPDVDMEQQQQQTTVRTVMLVKEEDLEQARGLFEAVSSIHIYSLEANTLKDLNVLTECNRKVRAEYASEDPLVAWKQYGTIQNPNAKRRTRRTAAPPPPDPTDSKTKTTTVAAKKDTPSAVKADSRPSSAKATPEPAAASTKSSAKHAAPKRDTSNIFKSFSKAASKPKKQKSQGSAESTPAPPAAAAEKEDEPMGGFSDDDDDEEDDMPTTAPTKKSAPAGKSKKEREAELQAMMDVEEEEQPKIEKDEDKEMADAHSPGTPPAVEEEEGGEAIDKPAQKKEEEGEGEKVTVENGRRRGRRRVMKKKTVKDEDGYLGEPLSTPPSHWRLLESAFVLTLLSQ